MEKNIRYFIPPILIGGWFLLKVVSRKQVSLDVNCLPDESWIEILSYLDDISLCRISQVSKRFHKLSSDESLWKRLFTNTFKEILDECKLESFHNSYKFIFIMHSRIQKQKLKELEQLEMQLMNSKRITELERISSELKSFPWKIGPKKVYLMGFAIGFFSNLIVEMLIYFVNEKTRENWIYNSLFGDYHRDKLVGMLQKLFPDEFKMQSGYVLRSMLMSFGFGLEVLTCWAFMRITDMYIDMDKRFFWKLWFHKDCFTFILKD